MPNWGYQVTIRGAIALPAPTRTTTAQHCVYYPPQNLQLRGAAELSMDRKRPKVSL